jgi:hypothetical protein
MTMKNAVAPGNTPADSSAAPRWTGNPQQSFSLHTDGGTFYRSIFTADRNRLANAQTLIADQCLSQAARANRRQCLNMGPDRGDEEILCR